MILPPTEHKQTTLLATPKLSRGLLRTVILIFLVCFGTYILTANFLSPNPLSKFRNWVEEHGYGVYGYSTIISGVPAFLARAVSRTDVPKLIIDIKFENIEELYKKRDEALKKGILIKETDDLIPAKIRYFDKTIKVKLRLKGDWTDHLDGDKWSFRIRVKGKSQLFGMRRFSIQHPKTRGYQGEALVFDTLRHVGVLVPRYFFVDVVVNGNKIGIMALEEHFSKELLEFNERRDGVIVRFDEALLWKSRVSKGEGHNDNVFNSYKNSNIDAFGSTKIKKSKKLSNDYAVAVGMLRSFVNGNMSASEVFDTELIGKYLAVVELWGARHSVFWHNQRFYLNPINLKLEPIGFDASLQERKPINSLAVQNESFAVALLQDQKVFSVYNDTIKKLADEILNGDLISDLEKIETNALEALHTEFYLLDSFPMNYLQKRAKYLLSVPEVQLKTLIISSGNYPEIVTGYIVNEEAGFYLELVNLIPHNVLVSDITCGSKIGNPVLQLVEQFNKVSLPLLLPPTPPQTLPQVTRLYFSSDIPEQCEINISAAIQGQQKEYQARAMPYYSGLKSHPLPSSDIRTQLSSHNFLSFDKKKKQLIVEHGKWQVSDSIIVPAGYTLIVPSGTVLQFDADGGIFSYGTMEFNGTAGSPVVLEGIDKDNESGTWQGVVVINAPRASTWNNVFVRNTTGIDQSSWQLTGGVTFYKSDITMESCSFINNSGEDALNIIQSQFLLKNITISNTASDAFDSDFSKGEIEGGLFENIGRAGGGDAIDISGSKVTMRGTKFININDKALSVGEKSIMNVVNIDVVSAGTGAASKDGSLLTIENSSIKFARNASLMAYVKKPEFGPGRINATNINFLSDVADVRVQKGSSVTIDGVEAKSENVDVKKLYETVMKPGLRP